MKDLDSFPRVNLGVFPTPIQKLENISALTGREVYIKRDDLTGLGLGGNKIRKLEFLLADARARGAEIVFTTGGAQSNHAMLTAAAAAKLGMRADAEQDTFEPGEPNHNAQSIQVTGVAYRADKALVRSTHHRCMLERGGVSRIKRSELTLEERIGRARDYLHENLLMRVGDYVRLTGLSRTTACQELRQLALDPSSGITSRGQRSQKHYILG